MAQSFSPATGVTGSVSMNTVTFCASEWSFDEKINVIPAPSFCGGAFMEYAFGKKSGVFSFSGIWDQTVGRNPFLLAFKLGVRVVFTLRINMNTIAVASTAVITEWQITDAADGVCNYTCSLVGDFTFNDFANTPA